MHLPGEIVVQLPVHGLQDEQAGTPGAVHLHAGLAASHLEARAEDKSFRVQGCRVKREGLGFRCKARADEPVLFRWQFPTLFNCLNYFTN